MCFVQFHTSAIHLNLAPCHNITSFKGVAIESIMEAVNYLEFCSTQKCVDEKTLEAYHIDLRQFLEQICTTKLSEISSAKLVQYIATLHKNYKSKTAKRKIASTKVFFHFLGKR